MILSMFRRAVSKAAREDKHRDEKMCYRHSCNATTSIVTVDEEDHSVRFEFKTFCHRRQVNDASFPEPAVGHTCHPGSPWSNERTGSFCGSDLDRATVRSSLERPRRLSSAGQFSFWAQR